jgi:hypothetical protein
MQEGARIASRVRLEGRSPIRDTPERHRFMVMEPAGRARAQALVSTGGAGGEVGARAKNLWWQTRLAPTPLAGVGPRLVTRTGEDRVAGPHPAGRGGTTVRHPGRSAGRIPRTNPRPTPASGVGADSVRGSLPPGYQPRPHPDKRGGGQRVLRPASGYQPRPHPGKRDGGQRSLPPQEKFVQKRVELPETSRVDFVHHLSRR